MRRPLTLLFAFTLLALPMACGDDDGDDGGSGGATPTGGKDGTGGSTGGKASTGGSGGASTGGRASTGGAGGEAPSPEGGSAGDGTIPTDGGTAGEPAIEGGSAGQAAGAGGSSGGAPPSEGGSAGTPTTPTDGGTAGEGAGGEGGAPVMDLAYYQDLVCAKEPNGVACATDCEGSWALFRNCPGKEDEESPELVALARCYSEQPDDDFNCDSEGRIGLGSSECFTELCHWDAWCNDIAPECE